MMEKTKKFDVAMWILKVMESCVTHDQLRNCRVLVDRHLDTFHDFELGQILSHEMHNMHHSNKMKIDYVFNV